MVDYLKLRNKLLAFPQLKGEEYSKLITSRFLSVFFHQILISRVENQVTNQFENKFFKIDFNCNEIHVKFRSYVKSLAVLIALFFKFLLMFFSMIYFRLFYRSFSKLDSINMFFGLTKQQIGARNDFSDFYRYLENLVKKQNLHNFYIVESKNKIQFNLVNSKLLICGSPNLAAYTISNSFLHLLLLGPRIIYEFLFFLKIIFFKPVLQPIIADIFMERWLFTNSKIDNQSLIITPNNLFVQPINFHFNNKGYPRIMIWYSASAIKLSESQKYLDDSFYKYLPIDIHWVWNLEHKKYLDDITTSQNIVVGPQLFYLPNAIANKSKKYFDICVMDITPTEWKLYEGTPYGLARCYWFLSTVINVYQELSIENEGYKDFVRLFFKYKRKPESIHSSRYVDYIEYSLKNGILEILPHNINLFDYLRSIDLLITTKFTSVGVVAESVNCPVIYLEPEEYVKWFSYKSKTVSDSESLKTEITRLIRLRAREDSNL